MTGGPYLPLGKKILQVSVPDVQGRELEQLDELLLLVIALIEQSLNLTTSAGLGL